MFVVAGVTGSTGSVVAETFLERKQRVRVIVRTPEKAAVWKEKGGRDRCGFAGESSSGREVMVQQVPLTAVSPTFTAMGFSANAAGLFEEMYAGLESGITFEGNGACRPVGLVTFSEALSGWV